MKIICTIDNEVIQKAVGIVNLHHKDFEFLSRVAKEIFCHTTGSGKEVANRIEASEKVFYIVPLKYWNPFSRMIGRFEDPNHQLNIRKLHTFTLESAVEHIFHENVGHGLGYGHDGNRVTKYNLETFPYKGARMFVEYCKDIGALP
jgi:hypothetical protein